MEKSTKNYPVFDFTIEGFEKLRDFSETINDIDNKVQFFDSLAQRFDEINSGYQEPIGINFLPLLELEKDYWAYFKKLAKSVQTPKIENDDSFSDQIWIDNFTNEYIFKLYFQRWELFDYDLDRIKEHSKEIGSIYSQILYLRFVFKEFKIQAELYPDTYTKQRTGNFESNILKRIRILDDKIKEKAKISKTKPQHRPTSKTDLEKLLYFAGMLQKLRTKGTHYNYNAILEHIAKKYTISKYTLPNWIKNNLKYLEQKKDILDLTEEDIKLLWHQHKGK